MKALPTVKYLLLIGIVLASMLIISNLFLASAQDSGMREFVSESEFFSIQVPADWHTEEVVPGIALVTANSEAAFARYSAGETPESGDFVVNVGFLPYEVLRQRELASWNIQFDATPDIFLQSFLPLFRLDEETLMGDAQLISLSDTRDAGQLSFSDGEREGTVVVFHAGEEIVGFVSTVGAVGETADFQDVTYAIATEAEFSAPQQTLWFALLGR
jgi:hypothetical protein